MTDPKLLAAEAALYRKFPDPQRLETLSIFTARKMGYSPDRSRYRYLEDFSFISDEHGRITVRKGYITDLGSVPLLFRGLPGLDNDSPILVYPSGPHDWLCRVHPVYGTRGWIDDERQLSASETNDVLIEGCEACGANPLQIIAIRGAVACFLAPYSREFRR